MRTRRTKNNSIKKQDNREFNHIEKMIWSVALTIEIHSDCRQIEVENPCAYSYVCSIFIFFGLFCLLTRKPKYITRVKIDLIVQLRDLTRPNQTGQM